MWNQFRTFHTEQSYISIIGTIIILSSIMPSGPLRPHSTACSAFVWVTLLHIHVCVNIYLRNLVPPISNFLWWIVVMMRNFFQYLLTYHPVAHDKGAAAGICQHITQTIQIRMILISRFSLP
jgi:hypothetical protein